MIILRASLVVDGKYHTAERVAHKWTDDTDFPFNRLSGAQWYFYLKRLRVGGKPLPRVSEGGSPVIYRVHTWGGKSPILTLFPGMSNDGKKLSTVQYGRLDKNEEFWKKEIEGE